MLYGVSDENHLRWYPYVGNTALLQLPVPHFNGLMLTEPEHNALCPTVAYENKFPRL